MGSPRIMDEFHRACSEISRRKLVCNDCRTHWRIARAVPSTPRAVRDACTPFISPLSIGLTNGYDLFFAKERVPNVEILAKVIQHIHRNYEMNLELAILCCLSLDCYSDVIVCAQLAHLHWQYRANRASTRFPAELWSL